MRELRKLTRFERTVLLECLKIPKGEVRTYMDIAKSIGRNKACRAVGNALSKNPFPLLIPCHRVIKSNGKVGGYLGKSDETQKKRLLKKEGWRG
ncbi:MAG: MGMT family protein [Candidatus Anstonellales archaeon]